MANYSQEDIMEVPHCKLEEPHYNAVKQSVHYCLEGLMDILREEIAMSMPRKDMDAEHNRED